MGVQVVVRQGVNGPVHPGWSSIHCASDRDFVRWMASLPRNYAKNDPWSPAFKPIDIPRWRTALPSHRNDLGRFVLLFDLMEAEDDLWIHLAW